MTSRPHGRGALRRRLLPALLLCTLCSATHGQGEHSGSGISAGTESHVRDPFGSRDCHYSDVERVLTLLEAIDRALCSAPEARQAWSEVKNAAAHVDTARAAFMPDLSAQFAQDGERSTTDTPTDPNYDSDVRSISRSAKLELSVVLYDFGLRAAQVNSARQALAAAMATENDSLRTVLLNVVSAYYDVVNAQDTLRSDRDQVDSSAQLAAVAKARFDGGAALITDKLQADSAYSQALIKRSQDEGKFETSRGALSVLADLAPDMPYDVDQTLHDASNISLTTPLRTLIEEALANSDKLQADAAQIREAQAEVVSQGRSGLPTVELRSHFTRSYDRYNSASQFAINQTPANNHGIDRYAGIQVVIPLTNFADRASKVRSAKAQLAARESRLDSDRRQATLDVWTDYQSFRTAVGVALASDELLRQASEYYAAAAGRYQGGAGTLTDALTAQHALEDARLKRADALAELGAARLNLLIITGALKPFGKLTVP